MSSVKKNFSYNLLLTMCGYVFPLITYPYVSRVLGVQNIGVCNFVDSIINYFILFSMLGIGSFGVREIARVREEKNKLDNVFSSLIVFNIITTIIAVVVLVICTYCVPSLVDYKQYLLLGVVKLVFNTFLIEWFFQGVQDFKYITIRSLIVRIIYVVAVFVFIHDEEDAVIYYFLTVLTTIINAIINSIYARNFVSIKRQHLDLRILLVPVLTFGYYRILTSMYTTFNTVFLGFVSGDVEVGYFSTATKLYAIIMSVLTAFTTVMVPKVSELLHKGQVDKLQWIATQTLSIITIFSVPLIFYCEFCAADIIRLIAGPGYEGAITPFRIVISSLLIIGSEQILIQQFLMASPRNKPIFLVSTFGAITGVVLNIILTPLLGSTGSAIAWGVSELVVFISGVILVKRNLGVLIPIKTMTEDLLWSLLYIVPLLGISILHYGMWLNLVVSGIAVTIVFIIINMWLHKNELLIEMLNDARKLLVR